MTETLKINSKANSILENGKFMDLKFSDGCGQEYCTRTS